MPHLLIVDDDRRLLNLLKQYLESQHFSTRTALKASEAQVFLAQENFDLMVLDVMMPDEDGIQFVKRLESYPPVLFLSAKDTKQDIIDALEAGGDDYLTKPFDPDELVARIKSILRRGTRKKVQPKNLTFGPFSYDQNTGDLTKNQQKIILASAEMILLKVLASSPFKTFTREELSQKIGYKVSERSVDVQITRLRKSLEDDPKSPKYIQTIRHLGYCLCPDNAPS